ncbi:MAG: hypothetical protein JXB35_09175, partial [Anaerolineae bacterium]|nr:hypothetical protein [Anaerolineae bacterium]
MNTVLGEVFSEAPDRFWMLLDALVHEHAVIVDRPAGSEHPRYPGCLYPLDYGYLDGTVAVDGDGIDVWLGSLTGMGVTGIVCTVDRLQQDVEVKILIDCSVDEAQVIVAFHNSSLQAGILLMRKCVPPHPNEKPL